jgi:hypothetical protein
MLTGFTNIDNIVLSIYIFIMDENITPSVVINHPHGAKNLDEAALDAVHDLENANEMAKYFFVHAVYFSYLDTDPLAKVRQRTDTSAYALYDDMLVQFFKNEDAVSSATHKKHELALAERKRIAMRIDELWDRFDNGGFRDCETQGDIAKIAFPDEDVFGVYR